MKHERACSVCGEHYSYCPNCSAYASLPRWMFLFHDENCLKIWQTINSFKTGNMDAAQAKEALEELDLSKRSNFNKAVKADISKIFSEANKMKQAAPAYDKPKQGEGEKKQQPNKQNFFKKNNSDVH